MIRNHHGHLLKELLKIEKKDFKSDQEYYSFLWKKKYNIVFDKVRSENIKSKLQDLIKKFDKK